MADPAILQLSEFSSILASMDLDVENLRDAVRYADAERGLVSRNDTPGLDQALMYHKLGRGLRDKFCGEHWEIDNSDNHTAIKHRTKPLRVVPCNFDENTANVSIQPSNRTHKGAVMESRTRCNATGSLFAKDDLPIRSKEGIETWVLGVYAFGDAAPRAELSLPVAFTNKHISSLDKRIILLDGTESSGGIKERAEPIEVVEIEIRPRGQ